MTEYLERETREDGRERRARELNELLQELRVVLPGVQVLFAFLLTVPFATGFSNVTTLQRYAFFGTLMLTAMATALLIAPSAHHRLLWREHLREQRLQSANRLTIAGLIFLLAAMVSAVFMISDVIFGFAVAAFAAAAAIAFFVYLWFGLPLWYYQRES